MWWPINRVTNIQCLKSLVNAMWFRRVLVGWLPFPFLPNERSSRRKRSRSIFCSLGLTPWTGWSKCLLWMINIDLPCMNPVLSGFPFLLLLELSFKYLWLAQTTRFLANSVRHIQWEYIPTRQSIQQTWGCPNLQLSYCVTCGGNYYAEDIWRWSEMTSALCSFNGHQLWCPRNLVPSKEFLSWSKCSAHLSCLGLHWENPPACSIKAMLPITVVSTTSVPLFHLKWAVIVLEGYANRKRR